MVMLAYMGQRAGLINVLWKIQYAQRLGFEFMIFNDALGASLTYGQLGVVGVVVVVVRDAISSAKANTEPICDIFFDVC